MITVTMHSGKDEFDLCGEYEDEIAFTEKLESVVKSKYMLFSRQMQGENTYAIRVQFSSNEIHEDCEFLIKE
jgi:hypothetical protein